MRLIAQKRVNCSPRTTASSTRPMPPLEIS
jgi:hypothetical protein